MSAPGGPVQSEHGQLIDFKSFIPLAAGWTVPLPVWARAWLLNNGAGEVHTRSYNNRHRSCIR